jgi:hypothetical protein
MTVSSDSQMPANIESAAIEENAPYDDLVQRMFRRQSIEDNIPINELVFEGKYSRRYER